MVNGPMNQDSELEAGQPEADVPGREQDLLSWMVYWGVRSPGVGPPLVPQPSYAGVHKLSPRPSRSP